MIAVLALGGQICVYNFVCTLIGINILFCVCWYVRMHVGISVCVWVMCSMVALGGTHITHTSTCHTHKHMSHTQTHTTHTNTHHTHKHTPHTQTHTTHTNTHHTHKHTPHTQTHIFTTFKFIFVCMMYIRICVFWYIYKCMHIYLSIDDMCRSSSLKSNIYINQYTNKYPYI